MVNVEEVLLPDRFVRRDVLIRGLLAWQGPLRLVTPFDIKRCAPRVVVALVGVGDPQEAPTIYERRRACARNLGERGRDVVVAYKLVRCRALRDRGSSHN